MPPLTRRTSYGNFSLPVTLVEPCNAGTRYRITLSNVVGPTRDGVALAELRLFGSNQSPIGITSITNPGGVLGHVNQRVDRLYDGALTNKWFDSGFATSGTSVLEITLSRRAIVHSYEFFTAPDGRFRDPVAWLSLIHNAEPTRRRP